MSEITIEDTNIYGKRHTVVFENADGVELEVQEDTCGMIHDIQGYTPMRICPKTTRPKFTLRFTAREKDMVLNELQ